MLLRHCCRFRQRFRQQCRTKFRPFDNVAGVDGALGTSLHPVVRVAYVIAHPSRNRVPIINRHRNCRRNEFLNYADQRRSKRSKDGGREAATAAEPVAMVLKRSADTLPRGAAPSDRLCRCRWLYGVCSRRRKSKSIKDAGNIRRLLSAFVDFMRT